MQLGCLLLLVQAGDIPGEEQPALAEGVAVPPAPVRSPGEERATFALAPDLAVELVAAEPLVCDPVQAVFDELGRLWVCEMRGFMPDAEGRGEGAPVGAIAVLTDEDGDGDMDRRAVFLDRLVLPRAVAPCEGGALVIAPPELLLCRDTDGDLAADERTVLARGLGGIGSPEHAINGLDFGLNGAYRCANARVAWKRVDGVWTALPTLGGGQWGISHDDRGRAFHDNNSEPLRGDLFPSRYGARNPHLGPCAGLDLRLCEDFSTFPAHPTPGVNRGYRAGTLRADLTLASVTAACAPFVYRGDGLPARLSGDVFVCEPAGNLLLRYELEAQGLALRARRAEPERDFLTSSDERFRPVNLASGPDGALYVVDMYRGLIQHRLFVTSFLRGQVERRGLAAPTGLGRIWRIVAADARARRPRALPGRTETWRELVALLERDDGWTRDTVRRLLLEEGGGSRDVLELLRERIRAGGNELARVHALWALAGLGGLDPALLRELLGDARLEVRLTAVRLSERFLAGEEGLLARVIALGRDPDERLAHQVLLSLGEVRTEAAEAAMLELVALAPGSAERRAAVLSGLGGRELGFLARLLASAAWREQDEGRARLVAELAGCIVRAGRGDALESVLELLADGALDWQRSSLGAGMLGALPPIATDRLAPIRLAREPPSWARLSALPEAAALLALLSWPGHPAAGEQDLRALTAVEEQRFARGRESYAASCAACHLDSGTGDPGKAPSLRGSPRVVGEEGKLVRILLQGLIGPVPGFEGGAAAEMPALAGDDGALAAVATYLRREWGHGADPVTPESVAGVRAATKERSRPWTVAELEGK